MLTLPNRGCCSFFVKIMFSTIRVNVRFLYIGISVICFLGLLFVLKSNTSLSSDVADNSVNLKSSRTKSVTEGLLDGCYHVYLDVGSNVGVQV